MFDARLRARVGPGLHRLARPLARARVSPGLVTAVGLLVGLGACAAVATRVWALALGLWLANRLLDGLDGPLARGVGAGAIQPGAADERGGATERGDATERVGATELGGLLDFVADFVVYAGFVVAVAIAHRPARLACVVLLATYLVNNVALLSFSSMVERLGLDFGDERSLRFTTGLAEGTETIVAYGLFCVLPGASQTIAWAFAAMVAVTAVQRVVAAVAALGGVPRRPVS